LVSLWLVFGFTVFVSSLGSRSLSRGFHSHRFAGEDLRVNGQAEGPVRAAFCGANWAEMKKPPEGGFCSSLVLGGAVAFGFALANC
jgi:hypothetical protein